jgi:hypothetical protein
MNIEDELEQALRAEDPGAAFTQRVLARAREERSRRHAGAPPDAAEARGTLAPHAAGLTPQSETPRQSHQHPQAPPPQLHSQGQLPVSPLSSQPQPSHVEPLRVASSPTSSSPTSSAVTSSSATRSSGQPAGERRQAKRWVAAALAASLALAAAGTQWWVQHQRYVAEGERARAEVLAAMRLTSQKLNIVHDKIVESTEAR